MRQQLDKLRSSYALCKQACQSDWAGSHASSALKQFAIIALQFLQNKCVAENLVSHVPGKNYIGFRRKESREVISRPANQALFRCDADTIEKNWDGWISGTLPKQDLAQISYTACLAPCLALELFDRQNKKGPATSFECMIGHVFARALCCNPQKAVSLKVAGTQVRMTMDFLFHPSGQRRVHLPVKMSTRERVVQAWAHQRILEGAYVQGTYRGIMVVFAETKLDSKSLEVVEVCVPGQWLTYQSLISHMERIYYLDLPERYRSLSDQHADLIQVRELSEFFREKDQVLAC